MIHHLDSGLGFDSLRSGFYGSYDPLFISYPYVIGFGLTLFVIGAYLLRRHARLLLDQ